MVVVQPRDEGTAVTIDHVRVAERAQRLTHLPDDFVDDQDVEPPVVHGDVSEEQLADHSTAKELRISSVC